MFPRRKGLTRSHLKFVLGLIGQSIDKQGFTLLQYETPAAKISALGRQDTARSTSRNFDIGSNAIGLILDVGGRSFGNANDTWVVGKARTSPR